MLTWIAGPCVIESASETLALAAALRARADSAGIPFVFKASFLKANRSSGESPRGPGLDEGLAILARVRSEVGVPVLTDVHEVAEVAAAAEVVDWLQIPAFLCRQTPLIEAAAATGCAVNLKKGQFVLAADMAWARRKAAAAPLVMVTERGTLFGPRELVVDPRSLVDLGESGGPVCYDATHSVQTPGGEQTGGARRYALPLLRAALAIGVDAVFSEVHPDPDRALSDRGTQWPLARVGELVDLLRAATPRDPASSASVAAFRARP